MLTTDNSEKNKQITNTKKIHFLFMLFLILHSLHSPIFLFSTFSSSFPAFYYSFFSRFASPYSPSSFPRLSLLIFPPPPLLFFFLLLFFSSPSSSSSSSPRSQHALSRVLRATLPASIRRKTQKGKKHALSVSMNFREQSGAQIKSARWQNKTDLLAKGRAGTGQGREGSERAAWKMVPRAPSLTNIQVVHWYSKSRRNTWHLDTAQEAEFFAFIEQKTLFSFF